jgi:hypothetical protein
MTILLDAYTLPERGAVELTIQRSFEIKVTAEEARRKVISWLVDQVSYMVSAESPALMIGEYIVWRVPVILTAPQVGRVGEIGAIHVDVQTGEMDNTPERITALQQWGLELGNRLPPYKSRGEAPDEYVVKDMQPTHIKPNRKKNPNLSLRVKFGDFDLAWFEQGEHYAVLQP